MEAQMTTRHLLLRNSIAEFLKWEGRRGLHCLVGDFKTWREVRPHAYSDLCNHARDLDIDACREFAKWLGSYFPPSALPIIKPQLPAFANLLGLHGYEALFIKSFIGLRRDIKDWSERDGVNVALLPKTTNAGTEDSVKLLRAIIVDFKSRPLDCNRRNLLPDRPGTYTTNFRRDDGCQESMNDAVRACRRIFGFLSMLGILIVYLSIFRPILPFAAFVSVVIGRWLGVSAGIWLVLLFLFFLLLFPLGLSCRCWLLLRRASIYFQLEGIAEGSELSTIENRSMGLATAIAVLIALPETCPSLALWKHDSAKYIFLPRPIALFLARFIKEAKIFGFSGYVDRDGMIRPVGGVLDNDDKLGPKPMAFLKAGITSLVFPRGNRPSKARERSNFVHAALDNTRVPIEEHPNTLRAQEELNTRAEPHIYWSSCLLSLLLVLTGSRRRGWMVVNASILVILCPLSFLLPLPGQEARIVDGWIIIDEHTTTRLDYSDLDKEFYGEINGEGNYELRLIVWAGKYNPSLRLRVTISGARDSNLEAATKEIVVTSLSHGIYMLWGVTGEEIKDTKFIFCYRGKKSFDSRVRLRVETISYDGHILHIDHIRLDDQFEPVPHRH